MTALDKLRTTPEGRYMASRSAGRDFGTSVWMNVEAFVQASYEKTAASIVRGEGSDDNWED